ncbi:enoyl-CoA hydratase/isomerase family protein [Microbulbifer pacificus]|uniref:Enoyl-CoA hydratase-related protein n=1 Tax=Microbulbifer pacificus TaxID=407164 RepID=A0AAU0MYW9_9GAMM|nr:enoyl-CoA hydratase-related protein [Microbulbifer pacificus]WOX05298.1 enoyl-CoA hydratase-related protein [Microbulbifer pacificus]
MELFETVLYSVEQEIATITLNRPQVRNSLNQKLRLELREAVAKASADKSVRAVVLAASGQGFCAGADLTERLPGADEDGFVTRLLNEEYNPLILAIKQSPKPFVCAINGAAAGVGASLAMACDLIVMGEDAYLYSAFGAISLIPDGGAHKFLLEQLGSKRAYEMIALSQKLAAARCVELGLANRVVPAGELLVQATRFARQVAAAAPLTLQYSKQILREAQSYDLESVMALEAEIQNRLIRSKDFREGSMAFFEKRKPEFEGC